MLLVPSEAPLRNTLALASDQLPSSLGQKTILQGFQDGKQVYDQTLLLGLFEAAHHGNWEAPKQLLAEIETLPKGKPNSYWNSQQEDAIEALMQAELNPRSFVAVHLHLLSI